MNYEDTEELELLKKRLLKMFRWYHHLCETNGLRYYAIGGTMLGIIRHHGFIPWDDDIDVGMPRKDYEKFLSMTAELEDSIYRVEYATQFNLEYTCLYAKIYDTNTTLIEDAKKPIKRGIYIDIFPLDGIGNTEKEKERNYNKIKKWISLHAICTSKIRKGRKWYKNLSVILGSFLSVFIKERYSNNKITYLSKQNDYDKSRFTGNLVGRWWEKEIMSSNIYGKPTLYDFEDIKMYGVEHPDMYLNNMYGDYMELPPVEKRLPAHDYLYRDLCRSYINDSEAEMN